ncbi:MAG: NADH-quinone oxidoreductase subunit NuoH [Bdellovibrionales bacterium]|nr:NADH-quinone oxidoreductase subunit NuoH [Bdellovibrionales bacterium]
MDMIDWVIFLAKPVLICVIMLQVVPIMVWVERRGSALIQNRLGPNRIGPLGLLQSLADAIKMMTKEDFIPGHVMGFYYQLAPVLCVVPAFMTFAVIPFAGNLVMDGRTIHFQAADLNVGVLYILSITSLAVYGIIMAGWASNNKYALLGSLRSSAQMISYELTMGLALVGIIMTFSSVQLADIVAGQSQTLIQLGPIAIPKLGIFVQPIGFFLFTTAVFAETNRLPFDLPEGESEIVAGYHLEYSSMKFGLFMMGEYISMAVGSALISTLYFGGFQMLPGMGWLHGQIVQAAALPQLQADLLRVGFEIASFTAKTGFWLWTFVWVRWTIPRFRYDQLMDLGWKFMLPVALLNIFATGFFIYKGWI